MMNKRVFALVLLGICYLFSLYAQIMDANKALLKASKAGDYENIFELVKISGADVNVTDEDQRTPLMYASLEDNVSTVERLLTHDPLLDIQDKEGHTALIHAIDASPDERITENSYKILEMLLEHGANPRIKNKQGKTAIDLVRAKKVQDDLAHQSVTLLKRYMQKFPEVDI